MTDASVIAPESAIGLDFAAKLAAVDARLVHGAVVDFLDVHAGDLHWPAFNVADSAITVGVALMLLDIPGKVRLEKALLARPAAHAAINKIRRLTGCEPLQMPPTSSSAAAKKAPPDPLDKNGSH